MLRKNKNIKQSYKLTIAKYNYNVYEKRVMYRIIEAVQYLKEGISPANNFIYDSEGKLYNVRLELPISKFLTDRLYEEQNNDITKQKKIKDKNYNRIKNALEGLATKGIRFENDKVWQFINVIAFPEVEKYDRKVVLSLHAKMFYAIQSTLKGYRQYEIGTAINLSSPYSMRFYEIVSTQNQLKFSVGNLKDIFQVSDKYIHTSDFKNKVIEPAKKELDAKAPFSFTYESLLDTKKNKTGRKKIVAFRFTPVEHPENRNKYLEEKSHKRAIRQHIPIKTYISSELEDVLKNQVGFSDNEIRNNYDLFHQFKLLDLSIDHKVVTRAKKAKNPQGYIINTLKRKIDAQSQIPIEYVGGDQIDIKTKSSKALKSSDEDIDLNTIMSNAVKVMEKGEDESNRQIKDVLVNTTIIQESKTKKLGAKKQAVQIEDAVEVTNDTTSKHNEVYSLQESKASDVSSEKTTQDVGIKPDESIKAKEAIKTPKPTIEQLPTSDVSPNNIEFKAVFQNYLHSKEIDGKYADLIKLANILDIKFDAATISSIHKKKHFINYVQEKTLYKTYKTLQKEGVTGELLYANLRQMVQAKSGKTAVNIQNDSINLPPIQNIVNSSPFQNLPVKRPKFFKRLFLKLFKRKKKK